MAITTITTARNTFLQRLMGAAALDTVIYDEVEAKHFIVDLKSSEITKGWAKA
jgi:hypothetical protein